MRNERYDIIIIGTGAGGATMAHALADSGARLLVLERGDFVPREEENWNPEAVWKHLRYRVREQWIDRSGEEFRPYALLRRGEHQVLGQRPVSPSREDFQAMEHVDGVSPAWPIDYETLEPCTIKRSVYATSEASTARIRARLRGARCRCGSACARHGQDRRTSAARAESFVAAARFAETWPGGWLRPVQHLQLLPVQEFTRKAAEVVCIHEAAGVPP